MQHDALQHMCHILKVRRAPRVVPPVPRGRLTGRGRGVGQIGFRGRLHRVYVYPVGMLQRTLLWVLAPMLGAATREKLLAIAPTKLHLLHEHVPRALLPVHLGGEGADISALSWDMLDPPPSASDADSLCTHPFDDSRLRTKLHRLFYGLYRRQPRKNKLQHL